MQCKAYEKARSSKPRSRFLSRTAKVTAERVYLGTFSFNLLKLNRQVYGLEKNGEQIRAQSKFPRLRLRIFSLAFCASPKIFQKLVYTHCRVCLYYCYVSTSVGIPAQKKKPVLLGVASIQPQDSKSLSI